MTCDGRDTMAKRGPKLRHCKSLARFAAVALAFVHLAAPSVTMARAPSPATGRDGSHDFDFEIGSWKTHLRRLVHPLSHSDTWVEYDGVTTVRKVWDGAANLVELNVTGPSGKIEALSLRLYDPATGKWSLNFANRAVGQMSSPPTIGAFKDGRGAFFDEETFNGRPILVRFVISDITATSCQFEQAYSDDGGKTWEINWTATDTRVSNRDD